MTRPACLSYHGVIDHQSNQSQSEKSHRSALLCTCCYIDVQIGGSTLVWEYRRPSKTALTAVCASDWASAVCIRAGNKVRGRSRFVTTAGAQLYE